MRQTFTKPRYIRRSARRSANESTTSVRLMEQSLSPLLHEMKLREERTTWHDFVIAAGAAMVAAALVVMFALIWTLQPAI
ncbi:hypothetical protein AWB64_02112 [Caballeronia sordidicola]|uniref:Uncharacterized protein n=1 Tax=Caballeronia sordidicola TaxID=196367 RepID=A0A158G253_CABSO|nr:hypothetical protein AWB64_02112 [Caballeronia sordidicola]